MEKVQLKLDLNIVGFLWDRVDYNITYNDGICLIDNKSDKDSSKGGSHRQLSGRDNTQHLLVK